MFDRAEERPRASPDLLCFEFWSPKATFGGHIALWRWPAQHTVWYTTAIFREAAPLVTLTDEFALGRTLEIRGNGLWADHNIEEPFGHWSIGLEAFALALEDPTDDRGERVPLGYELDWELDHAVIGALDDGYEQPARVRGEVLLGVDAYEIDGLGWRSHTGLTPTPAARRRHGQQAGDPRWSRVDDVVRPGDGALGWSLAVTPAGRLWKGLWRDGHGGTGFVESGGPPR